MFRGDAAHTGLYSAPLGRELAGLQWFVNTDGGVVSSPAVVGDTVWIGSADGKVRALDRESGVVRWTTDLHSPVSSSPAIVEGRVFVSTRGGHIVALRSDSGSVIWNQALGPDRPWHWGHESGDFWTSSVVVSGDLAIVGGGDGNVYALDIHRGTERWRATTGGRVRATPAVADGRVFVGSADGRMYALDLMTGKTRWTFATVGDTLESGHFGYDRRTIQSSAAVAGNSVVFGARDGFVYALSADSGKLQWRYDHKISWINSSPAIADGVVYDGSSDGHFLQALDAKSGTELWRAQIESIIWSSPAVVGDLVVVGDGGGRVRAYDRKSGAVRWIFATGAAIYSSPVPSGKLVIVGSNDGGIYAIRTSDTATVRAVFVDTAGPVKPEPADARTIDYFTKVGYTPLNSAGLGSFLRARIADRTPSVIAFGMDNLPVEVVAEPLPRSLLRQYLDRGGKVVWWGVPPLLLKRDPKTGEPGGLDSFQWEKAGQLLGISVTPTLFDRRMTQPTAAGRRWGLVARWRDSWGIDPAQVSEVLGLDDWGFAASWVKSFGGGPGTGFIRAPTGDAFADYLLSEYRPGGHH